MKKFLCGLFAVCVLLFVSCGTDASSEDVDRPVIGVIVSDNSDSSMDMENGLIEGLQKAGYTRETTDIVCKYAGYEGYPLEDICSSMADGTYDAVVCIGAQAAEQFIALGSATPCFVCGVSTVYEIGLTERSDPYVTGILDCFPAEETVALVNALTPDVDKFGLLYMANVMRSESTVNGFCQYLDSVQIDYTLMAVSGVQGVTEVADALIMDGAKAIFIPSDEGVHAELSDLVSLCCDKGVPVYCFETAAVKLGGLATVSCSDSEMGHQTAELVSRFFTGERIIDMPFANANADFCAFNETTASRLGITYPESARYKTVKYS